MIHTWFLIHKWTSLVCMAFLLLLCLTGLPLIFHEEIDQALGYRVAPPAMPNASGPASLDAIVADARSRRPDHAVQFVVRDPDEPHVWFVRLGETVDAPEASAFYTYDARTGAFLHEYPLHTGVMHVLLRLHVDMFAGLPGTLFLGVMGVLFVASLVSGAVLYGPYMRRLAFGTVRRGRSPLLRWLDIHNLFGIVTFVWLFVVGATGVINTLAIPIFRHWQATQLAEMAASHSAGPPLALTGSAQRALAAARAAAPGMELSFMAFPGNDFASPHHFVAFMQGTTAWRSKLLTPVLIDAPTGDVRDRRDLPWYVSALLIAQPLHFGDYGGLPLKILWAALDMLAIVVLGSGLYLWVTRRHVSFDAWFAALQSENPGNAMPVDIARPKASAS
jgi:uncharacterized iron-regulated membrane protein